MGWEQTLIKILPWPLRLIPLTTYPGVGVIILLLGAVVIFPPSSMMWILHFKSTAHK